MSANYAWKPIKSEHADIIHDVSFDHHGKRMATCSSDQMVKVWEIGKDRKWHCTASWRTHSGSVWRVTWAHPEFGQVLATCSFDRTVAIWEEMSKGSAIKVMRDSNLWVNKTCLVDSRTSVTDVRFGPKHLGLLLATCSIDGTVRIYEAVDVMKLSNWQLQHEFVVSLNGNNINLSCLSWSTSRIHPSMIAVGSDDKNFPSDPKVFIYRYNDSGSIRKWDMVESLSKITEPVNDVQFAPHLGRSFHWLAVASKELSIFTLKNIGEASHSVTRNTLHPETHLLGHFDDNKSLVWRVSWSVLGNKLATTGADGTVLLWKSNFQGHFQCHEVLKMNNMALKINPSISRSMWEPEQSSLMGASMSTTPTSMEIMSTPPNSGMMNIKRTSGWPSMNIDVDQSKLFY